MEDTATGFGTGIGRNVAGDDGFSRCRAFCAVRAVGRNTSSDSRNRCSMAARRRAAASAAATAKGRWSVSGIPALRR